MGAPRTSVELLDFSRKWESGNKLAVTIEETVVFLRFVCFIVKSWKLLRGAVEKMWKA